MRSALVVSVAALAVSLSAFAISPYPAPTIEAVVTYVVDGDTIEVLIRELPTPLPPAWKWDARCGSATSGWTHRR